MGACLSFKCCFKNNKVSPLAEEPEELEFDEDILQQAKDFLRAQYEMSLVSSSTQTGEDLEDVRESESRVSVEKESTDGLESLTSSESSPEMS